MGLLHSMAMKTSVLLFAMRFEAVWKRRKGAEVDCWHDVKCEVCGDLMRTYNGPKPGVICNVCLLDSGQGECVRVMPLAITRSAIRE